MTPPCSKGYSFTMPLLNGWQQIKEFEEKAREATNFEGDKIGEVTCFELLETLQLIRCLFL